MKLCGCKESCFIDGTKNFGHFGKIMCLYLSERKTKSENISICLLTNQDVNIYTTEAEYEYIYNR